MAKHFDSIDWSEHTQPFFFEGNKIGVLLIHGFTGAPGTMKVIGEALKEDGYTVSGIRLPGHGTNVKDMEKASWHSWLKAARSSALELQKKCDKIIVCGLSMGGLLALIIASELPVAGVATFAAAIELKDKMSNLAWLLKYFVRYRGSGEQDANEHPYKIGYNVTPIRKVPDLIKLQKIAKSGLSSITSPLIVFRAMRDETVTKNAADIIYSGAINAPNKELVDLPRSEHLCTVDNEANIIIEKLREFIIESVG